MYLPDCRLLQRVSMYTCARVISTVKSKQRKSTKQRAGISSAGIRSNVGWCRLRLGPTPNRQTRLGPSGKWCWPCILIARALRLRTLWLRALRFRCTCLQGRRSPGSFNILHSLPNFIGRGALRRSRRQGLVGTDLRFRGVLVELPDLFLGHQALVFETHLAPTLVAVPQDE